ncbi:MAG TPA: hypothetical protein VIL88_00825 [Devosia sp.]|jgi:hypothetical protein|uniref:hypothetical protein n=1 Tax=Devosia sp. TaxID=1871048 RepID=UPI002F929FE9
MRKPAVLSFATSLLLSGAALAQDTVVVDLSGIRTHIAGDLGIDVDDVPSTISLSAEAAAEVCGIAVGDLSATCAAISGSAELTAAIEAELDGNGNANSAREFAPGQQDGPAKDFAPGQQDGDARDSAPGQQKKQ